jgi:hypothetical protein
MTKKINTNRRTGKVDTSKFMGSALWYQRTRQRLINEYGDLADFMADLIAATSPQRGIAFNLGLAKSVYDCYMNGENWRLVEGLLPNHISNIDRAILGEPLRGCKVSAFSANLKGDLSRFTVDSILWRHYRGTAWITKNRYKKLAAALSRVAKRNGLKPAEYQAILWVAIRAATPGNLSRGGELSMFE